MTPHIEMRSTPALRIHFNTWKRAVMGIGPLLCFAFLGGILMIIPPVGICVLLIAIAWPFYAVFKPEFCDQFTGICPYCVREVKVSWSKAKRGGFNCKFCKRRLMVQGVEGDERFVAV